MSSLRPPQLDARLAAAARLGSDTRAFADIGADHGKLTTWLLLDSAERKALASDISVKALQKARARISHYGLEDRCVLSVSDGLDSIRKNCFKPDTVFILGMGGDTLSGILEHGQENLNGAALIVSAHTELPLLRQTIVRIGYRIRKEIVADTDGRQYILLKCTPKLNGEPAYTERELLLGPCLLREKPAEWIPVLKRKEKHLTEAINAMKHAAKQPDDEKIRQFEQELVYITDTLSQMEEMRA